MDRDRFRDRVRELRAFADRMAPLSRMPDRVTGVDLQLAADLATKAANSIDELTKAKPTGCICRHIENDNYSYLDYAEACLHHSQLYALSVRLKADYAKMEKALKNEARLKLVTAALSGTAGLPSNDDDLDENDFAKRAIAIADEAIRRIIQADA